MRPASPAAQRVSIYRSLDAEVGGSRSLAAAKLVKIKEEQGMHLPSRWLVSRAASALAAFFLSIGVAPAQSTQPIKIGFGMALTGGLAAGGKQALLVYELWAEEINARGGLLGRKVELTKYDDSRALPPFPASIRSSWTSKVDIVLSGSAPCRRLPRCRS